MTLATFEAMAKGRKQREGEPNGIGVWGNGVMCLPYKEKIQRCRDSITPASNDAIFYCAVAGKPLA